MIPIVSVVGKSDVGKTTLIEKLLREIKRRGYKVATIKHDVHGFNIDIPGKDTWRHGEAGADNVIISSPNKIAIVKKVEREMSLDEIADTIKDVDLIITEGYKRGDKPKIEVFRKGVYEEILCSPEELIALATDVEFQIGVPCYDLDDASGLVDRIEETVMKKQNPKGAVDFENGSKS
ncbi:molybdopterin-guanine dinucleotide biosynthesis protein B [Desulfitispora alkaliphila]|uniref:molybdopterin-guanine dinucleotide biosynthesis protein B n=1 Tax=Desulfitispora alkaliphila TaxID=622674 RepID=UPI003D2616E6